jgi:phage-related protein
MNVDDVTKLIYAIGMTGSVVGLSIFLMKLIHHLTKRVQESSQAVKNIGEISERLANNMEMVEETVQLFSSTISKVKNNFLDPLDNIAGLVGIIKEVVGMFTGGKEGKNLSDKDDN